MRYFLELKGRAIEVFPTNPEALAGLGEVEGDAVRLMPYEALYALEKGLTRLRMGGSEVSFQGLFLRLSREGFNASVYLVYRDLRERGYYVRRGVEPSYQLSVARRRDEPSIYKVVVLREGEFLRASRLSGVVREIIGEGKEPLLAIVDRRGEITYYRAFIFHGEQ